MAEADTSTEAWDETRLEEALQQLKLLHIKVLENDEYTQA